MKSIWSIGGYRLIGNHKGRAANGRSDKNPSQEKETVSSTLGTQISSLVMCETAKMVIKSNRRKDEGASCLKKEDKLRPTTRYR